MEYNLDSVSQLSQKADVQLRQLIKMIESVMTIFISTKDKHRDFPVPQFLEFEHL